MSTLHIVCESRNALGKQDIVLSKSTCFDSTTHVHDAKVLFTNNGKNKKFIKHAQWKKQKTPTPGYFDNVSNRMEQKPYS